MGTPQFAIPTLQALIASEHELLAVCTRPPKPSGRGRRERIAPIHRHAMDNGIQTLTPNSARDSDLLRRIALLTPDIILVAAYGEILPRDLLEIPRRGGFNIHASLLPRWRGAAPIQRALLAGDEQVGVTIIQMDAGMDTGPVRAMSGFSPEGMTAGLIEQRMAGMGAEMALEVVSDLDGHPPRPQPCEGATRAEKLTKDEAHIDFSLDALQVERMVRAFNPVPGAWTVHAGERLAIHACEIVEVEGGPGEIVREDFTIACGRGGVRPTLLQRPGRRIVSIEDMLHAHGGSMQGRCE